MLDSNLISTDLPCHICGAQQLTLLSNYPSLTRVTSDCVPWRSGGRLGICTTCLCVQNPVDNYWHTETTEIYGKYQIYRQSAGSEQGVFAEGKQLVPRSAKIFQKATSFLDLKKTGRLLDIGCANGELLRCFANIAPHWKMVGFEIDDKRREEVEKIAGVEAFASGSLEKLTGRFDLITIIHVLEHLPNPKQWLEALRKLLQPDGMILIQVPDPKQNPYNLLVADHCSHFIIADLVSIAERAGFQIIACTDAWVSREYSLLIKPIVSTKAQVELDDAQRLLQRTSTYPKHALQWLHDIVNQAQSLPNDKPIGVWGTAIAATWLFSIIGDRVEFFVDEDAHRIGQKHLGRPIYSPDQAPNDSNIFVALTPEIAANIVNRWSHLKASLHVPPELVY